MIKGRHWPKIVNVVQFQLGWFALVLGVAWGYPVAGMAVACVLLACHLYGYGSRRELVLLAAVGLLGWLWESVLYTLGLLVHPHWPPEVLVAPLWMAVLWLNFASTLNHSLAWLKDQPVLACLFGASGGPLAFWAGAKLGAVSFSDELVALVVLSGAWAVLMPLVMMLSVRLCGGGGQAAATVGEPI